MNISLTTKAIVGKQGKVNGLFNQGNILVRIILTIY